MLFTALHNNSDADGRTITAATLIVSIATHLGFIPAYYVVLLPYKILTLRSVPELWRLVSCFLLTGPQLQILMDPYFLYLYASKIEIETLPAPGDFFIYTVFVSAVITVCPTISSFACAYAFCLANLGISARPAFSSCHGSWN